MTLPHFAPFPDAKLRRSILPEEWHLYLDSWTSLAELYLRLDNAQFSSESAESTSLTTFLATFFQELAKDENLALDTRVLRKKCFLLLHRLFSAPVVASGLLSWPVLSDICHAFLKSEQFRVLFRNLWTRSSGAIEKSLQTAKTSLIRNLESKRPEEAENTLNRIAPLLKASTEANLFMLTGSDLLDALCSAYPQVPHPMQKKLITVAYLGLTAALEGPKPNYSLLSDHLYSLKATEEQEQKKEPGKKTLVADLVTNTPLLDRIRDNTTAAEASRVRNTAASLEAFKQSSIARPKRPVRRKVDKGKGKAAEDSSGYGTFAGEVHVHRMSIITQIQDLFPDLGEGFIVKLLDEYNDNIEEVTAHLLEDSLPPHLADADRSEKFPTTTTKPQSHLPPRSSQTYQRRNVFDDDEFDNLAVDTSRIHIGRKGESLDADKILSDRSKAPAKSSILAALAIFDADDDERDDTYDAEDVGASVDTAAPGPDDVDADLRDKNEEALFRAYTTTPELFGRDPETRRGKARAALKSETAMTDEAIEGWGIMIGRDPKRLRRLEARFSTFAGQQRELQATAWKNSPAASGDEGNESGQGGRGFGGRGRGRGRGSGGPTGGRGGGHVAGPADDKATQISRDRKEAHKASRANHNRKAQRGKKMARGGFPG